MINKRHYSIYSALYLFEIHSEKNVFYISVILLKSTHKGRNVFKEVDYFL